MRYPVILSPPAVILSEAKDPKLAAPRSSLGSFVATLLRMTAWVVLRMKRNEVLLHDDCLGLVRVTAEGSAPHQCLPKRKPRREAGLFVSLETVPAPLPGGRGRDERSSASAHRLQERATNLPSLARERA